MREAAAALAVPGSGKWPAEDCSDSFLGIHPMSDRAFVVSAILVDAVQSVFLSVQHRLVQDHGSLVAMLAVRLAELRARSPAVGRALDGNFSQHGSSL